MGFVNSCWPFGQQLYKLNIAEILKQTQEAVEKAEEAVEAAKKLQSGSVVSVNEIPPDENGNVEIPGISINQRCAQSLDFKGYWDGKRTQDFAINMGFKEATKNLDLSRQLNTFPVWLSGAYTIHGIPFSSSFAYAFGDPISSSKDIVVINPAEGEIIHFYLDGNVPKSEVISGSGSDSGSGTGGSVAWNPIYEGKLSESVSSIVIDSTADGTPLESLGVNELVVFGRFQLSADSKVRVENNGLWTVGNYATTVKSYGAWNSPFCIYQKQFTGGIVVEFSVEGETHTLFTNSEIDPRSYPIKSIEMHTETADVMFSTDTFVYAYYR